MEEWRGGRNRAANVLRILIVDPYRAGRDALCSCMAELGHEPLVAADVDEATKVQRQTPADLIVVDHSPPWTDGLRCIESLRVKSDIPAIVLLGSEAPIHGLTVTLLKPVSLVELERAIAAARRGGG